MNIVIQSGNSKHHSLIHKFINRLHDHDHVDVKIDDNINPLNLITANALGGVEILSQEWADVPAEGIIHRVIQTVMMPFTTNTVTVARYIDAFGNKLIIVSPDEVNSSIQYKIYFRGERSVFNQWLDNLNVDEFFILFLLDPLIYKDGAIDWTGISKTEADFLVSSVQIRAFEAMRLPNYSIKSPEDKAAIEWLEANCKDKYLALKKLYESIALIEML